MEDGLNSPWAQTSIQDITYNPCIPKGWIDLAKAVLTNTQYIKWCAYYKEESCTQAEANREAHPLIPITYGMLAGLDDGFSTGIQQAAVASPYRDQVRNAGLAAWYKLDEGPIESLIAGVRQKPNESLAEFTDRAQ